MKSIIIAIAGFLIISGTGIGAWLLTHKDDITNKVNNTKDQLVEGVTEAAKQKVLDEAKKYQPEGNCTTVMTPAKHKATGVEFTFPSGCLPSGWDRI
jgi:hypothetical protein